MSNATQSLKSALFWLQTAEREADADGDDADRNLCMHLDDVLCVLRIRLFDDGAEQHLQGQREAIE
jgi:hypothetical protein